MSVAPAVEASDVHYSVAGRVILKGVSLTVGAGRSLAVTGPSGTGKTTLLMCLAGILRPDAGLIKIKGTDMTGLRARARAAVRLRDVGIVYQFGELLPELSLVENVALPLLIEGTRKAEAYSRAGTLLQDLGLSAVASSSAATLSGGERQRAAVARALSAEPAVLLADEPTGSLDRDGGNRVADLLFGLPDKYGCALLVVTHNEDVAARADDQMVLGSHDISAVTTA